MYYVDIQARKGGPPKHFLYPLKASIRG